MTSTIILKEEDERRTPTYPDNKAQVILSGMKNRAEADVNE
jgi:hypothetical protein